MKKLVGNFFGECATCQRVNEEYHRPSSLYKPLEVLKWKWDTISKDFVDGFPLS